MLFNPKHIEDILSGKKTATRRLWKRRHAKPGGLYPVQAWMFQPKTECPLIRARFVYRQRLGDMTESDARKEGGYTLREFKEVFEIITKTKWDADLVVDVVEFELERKAV